MVTTLSRYNRRGWNNDNYRHYLAAKYGSAGGRKRLFYAEKVTPKMMAQLKEEHAEAKEKVIGGDVVSVDEEVGKVVEEPKEEVLELPESLPEEVPVETMSEDQLMDVVDTRSAAERTNGASWMDGAFKSGMNVMPNNERSIESLRDYRSLGEHIVPTKESSVKWLWDAESFGETTAMSYMARKNRMMKRNVE